MIKSTETSVLQNCIDRLSANDLSARDDLISFSCERLRVLTRNLSRTDRVRRFADTDDVLDGAVISLKSSLRSARPATVNEFLRLAAFHILRELTRLAREYYGPRGWATRHVVGPTTESWFNAAFEGESEDEGSPSQIASQHENVERLHEAVGTLDEDLREVVDLMWLHGLKQNETAEILGVTPKTIRRRWVRARLRLQHAMSSG